MHTRLGQYTLKDERHGHTARHTDELGHRLLTAVPVSVRLESRSNGLLLAVGADNLERVLQEHNVDLALLELAGVLEAGREGAHDGPAGLDGLLGEEAELAELGEEDALLVGGEGFEGLELGDDGAESLVPLGQNSVSNYSLLVGVGTDQLGGQLDPLHGLRVLGEVVDVGVAEEAELLPCLDDLAEATVPSESAYTIKVVWSEAYLIVPRTKFWTSGML